MEAQVKSALITAIATLTIFLCKDLVVALWIAKRADSKQQSDRLRLYIEPLVLSVKKLFWRLNEIFGSDGRGIFLRSDVPANEFNEYKKASTLYRVACVLGWKRAFRKELTFVKRGLVAQFEKVEESLRQIEGALADGTNVEMQRLSNIQKLWTHLEIPDARRVDLSVKLEQLLDRIDVLEILTTESSSSLSSEIVQTIAPELAVFFERELNIKTSSAVVEETKARIANSLCLRESWIYREWQEAIGDIVISRTENSDRRFEVVGYQEFLELCQSGSVGKRVLLKKLERLIEDVDVTIETDCRVQVLWSTYVSCAIIIKQIAMAFPDIPLMSSTEEKRITEVAEFNPTFVFLKR